MAVPLAITAGASRVEQLAVSFGSVASVRFPPVSSCRRTRNRRRASPSCSAAAGRRRPSRRPRARAGRVRADRDRRAAGEIHAKLFGAVETAVVTLTLEAGRRIRRRGPDAALPPGARPVHRAARSPRRERARRPGRRTHLRSRPRRRSWSPGSRGRSGWSVTPPGSAGLARCSTIDTPTSFRSMTSRTPSVSSPNGSPVASAARSASHLATTCGGSA